MSLDVMNRIWWREDVTGSEKWVLLALADSANDDGFCWLAIDTIGIKAGLKRRAVQNALKTLEAKTMIAIRRRTNRSNYFVINIAMFPMVERTRAAKETGPEETLFTGAFNARVTEATGAYDATRGAYNTATGASGAPITIIEPSMDPLGDSGDFEFRFEGEQAAQQVSLGDLVLGLYNEIAADNPAMASCRKVDPALAESIRARAREHAVEGQAPGDVWREALDKVRTSRFLRGLVPPAPPRTSSFRLTLSWMASRTHFREIIGGKYNGQDRECSVDPRTGGRFGPGEEATARTVASIRSAFERRDGRGDQGSRFARAAIGS